MARSDNPTQLRAGDIVGGYQLLMAVGAGGMGRVWAARRADSPSQSLVAVKVALEEMVGDEQFERMLLDEARIAASIVHPNVCAIREVGAERGIPYLVMDWMDAGSLLDLLTASPERRMDCYLATRIMSDVAAGLHAAHELTGADGCLLNVVHRDVSPQNILLSSAGHVKVADFGVAKARGQLHAPTETGQVKGKLSYMAPEQLTSKLFDRRADVFALGCCLYEATTGERPFHGGDALETMYKLLETDCALPTLLVADYPTDLEAIVLRALEKDPEKRYQSAEELRVALEGFLARHGRLVTDRDVSTLVRSLLAHSLDEKAKGLQAATRAIADKQSETLRTGFEITESSDGSSGRTPRTWSTEPPTNPNKTRRRLLFFGSVAAAVTMASVWLIGSSSKGTAGLAVNSSTTQAATPVPLVTVTLRTEPPGAALRIDDGPLLSSPQLIVTTPSQQLHGVSVSLEGFDPVTRQVVFDHNQELVLGLTPRVNATVAAGGSSPVPPKPRGTTASVRPTAPSSGVGPPGDAFAPKRKRPKRPIDSANPFADP